MAESKEMDLRSNYEEGAFELEFPGLNGSEFSFVSYGHFVIYHFKKILKPFIGKI